MMTDVLILVGVDGSDGGRRALRFALAEAVLRGCAVEAVRTVHAEDETELADHELWTDVESVRREVPGAPAVARTVLAGDPAEVLIDRSAGATLLVVGSHGTSSMIHSALGSVSNAVAQLARCPVVVVPRSVDPGGTSRPDGTSAGSARQ
jgi:nucleotide-binding universal stress UspA family protein